MSLETIPLHEALGRRLARDAISAGPVQPFDNSAMDGFAVRAADIESASGSSRVGLAVVDEARAGHPARRALTAGEAIAISTGAMLPAGSDTVVRVEHTERDGEWVLVSDAVPPGRDVRRAGEDLAAGKKALSTGTLLGAAELGVLASTGVDPVTVFRRPRVACLTTGDELVSAGQPLGCGEIYDSNAHALPALARLAGAQVVAVDRAPDQPIALMAALQKTLAADVAVVCGGISVGTHDYVRGALARLGVEELFSRVQLRPGSPTWCGRYGETVVFGLPGNPVSAFVAFQLFVRPAILALGGGRADEPRDHARLGIAHAKSDRRTHAIHARLEHASDGWIAWPIERRGSHVLTSLIAADCLALIPADGHGVAAGAAVEVVRFDRGLARV